MNGADPGRCETDARRTMSCGRLFLGEAVYGSLSDAFRIKWD